MTDQGEDQADFLIQTRLETPGGPQLQGDRGDAVIRGTQKQLDAAASLARKAGTSLHEVFKELAPDTGSVEFSLTFEGEAGLPVLAKGKAGATITVTLEWKGSAKS